MSKPGFRNTVLVRFEHCNHSRMFEFPYPVPGDPLYCPDCRKVRRVGELPDQLRVKCKTRHCTFARTGRPNMLSALHTSNSHIKSRNTHEVWIYKGNVPAYYVDSNGQGDIFQGEALSSVRNNTQKILRDFLDKVTPIEDCGPHEQPTG